MVLLPAQLRHRPHAAARVLRGVCSLGVVVLLAACSASPEATERSHPPAGSTTRSAPAGSPAELAWGRCADILPDLSDLDLAGLDRVGGDCAILETPIVHHELRADDAARGIPTDIEPGRPENVRLAVSRVPATGERHGAIVVNPGGPGGAAVGMPSFLIDAPRVRELNEHFDIIGLDLRGVGASTPSLRCRDDAALDRWRAAPRMGLGSDAEVAAFEAAERELADSCRDAVGATFLGHVGTRDNAHDLDALRRALGDERISLLGYSYGTFLGYEYARAFPDHIGALVLDGAVDPVTGLGETDLRQMAGFQRAFEHFAADCTGRADCALGSDPAPAAVSARMRDLLHPLFDTPLALPDGRRLHFSDAVDGVVMALYSKWSWVDLRIALRRLAEGGGEELMTLADRYFDRGSDGTYEAHVQDVFIAVNCVDWGPRPESREELARARALAPAFDPGADRLRTGTSACERWPSPAWRSAAAPGDIPAVVDGGRILVVTTTGDPATPYENGERLARPLGARLLSREGEGHTIVFEGEECVDDAVVAHLRDQGGPAGEIRCG